MRITDTAIANAYGVLPAQVGRWRSRGLNVESPDELMDALSRQHRAGSIFQRLSDPEERARIAAEIDRRKNYTLSA